MHDIITYCFISCFSCFISFSIIADNAFVHYCIIIIFFFVEHRETNFVNGNKLKSNSMKKLLTLFFVLPGLILALIIATSCTKEGPQGPAGEDGNASCGECHDSGEDFMSKVFQWEMSVHATGLNYDRNRNSCAPCHTSMGFREILETGADTTLASIENPTPINCYTCHKIHETYTESDWDLRTISAISFREGGATFDYGNANLCANCHQSRKASPYPGDAGGTIEFDDDVSYRWGPHHGPQANLFAGVSKSGAYEVGGSYQNSWHTNNFTDACNVCHMALPPYGDHWGGHTFSMGSLNTTGCTTSGCHSDGDAVEDNVEEKSAIIDDLLINLKTLLEDQGIMDTIDNPGYLNVPGTYSNELAGAFYNYKLIYEDRSHGMHNYQYTKTLLENSIAAIQ